MKRSKKELSVLKKAYRTHREHAAKRGIEFELLFEEWLKIWDDSGHLLERGNYGHQYCMARFEDKGPYIVGNVKIITVKENRAEQQMSEKERARLAAAMRGNTFAKGIKPSAETLAKRSAALKGRIITNEHAQKISMALKGNKNGLGNKGWTGQKHTPEYKAAMSRSLIESWRRRKQQMLNSQEQ